MKAFSLNLYFEEFDKLLYNWSYSRKYLVKKKREKRKNSFWRYSISRNSDGANLLQKCSKFSNNFRLCKLSFSADPVNLDLKVQLSRIIIENEKPI